MDTSFKQSRFGPIVQRLERMPYKRVMKFRLLLGPPFLLYTYNGCMAEWFKAPVLKTGIEKSIWGSNPYASAIIPNSSAGRACDC